MSACSEDRHERHYEAGGELTASEEFVFILKEEQQELGGSHRFLEAVLFVFT